MAQAHLHDRAVIALSGEDRIPFLQGLITNDAMLLEGGKALYAALLSPQGKFLHDFFLIPQAERILLDINATRAADLLARLALYKLRSKVTIALLPEYNVYAEWDEPARLPGEIAIDDPRLQALGARIYSAQAIALNEAGDYEAHRIALGIPDGAKDMIPDKSLLLEFGFEALHGVSFSKGCYVGQEVTARSKFRGQVRRQLYAVTSNTPLPACGTAITSGILEIGELRSTSGNQGLALMRSELLEKTIEPLTAGSAVLDYHTPLWMKQPAA